MRSLKSFDLKIEHLRKGFEQKKKQFSGDTRSLRGYLLVQLEETFDFAQKRMKAVRNEKHKQFWARLVSYIAQTIAYVAREYDMSNLSDKVVELEEKYLEIRKMLHKKQGYLV